MASSGVDSLPREPGLDRTELDWRCFFLSAGSFWRALSPGSLMCSAVCYARCPVTFLQRAAAAAKRHMKDSEFMSLSLARTP